MTETPAWTKSSYSDGTGGQCLEWIPDQAPTGRIPIRDSKDTTRTPLTFSPDTWGAFVQAVRASDT